MQPTTSVATAPYVSADLAVSGEEKIQEAKMNLIKLARWFTDQRIAYMIVVFTIALPMLACGSKEVKKAKDYIDAGMYDEAIELLSLEVQQNPTNAEAQYLLGLVHLLVDRDHEAVEYFHRAELLDKGYLKKRTKAYFTAGTRLLSRKQELAWSYFEKALEKEPSLRKEAARVIFEQAQSFLRESDKLKDGLELLEIVESLDAESDLSAKMASVYFETGMNLLASDYLTPAESLLSKAIELNPNYSGEIYSRYQVKGSEYFAKDEYAKASRLYGNGLKICLEKDTHSDSCLFPHYLHGVTKFINLGRTAGDLSSSESAEVSNIIKHLEVVIRLNEKHAGAHTYLYMCYKLIGKIEKALGEFQLAARLKPIEDNWSRLNSSKILNRIKWVRYRLDRNKFDKDFEAYGTDIRNMIWKSSLTKGLPLDIASFLPHDLQLAEYTFSGDTAMTVYNDELTHSTFKFEDGRLVEWHQEFKSAAPKTTVAARQRHKSAERTKPKLKIDGDWVLRDENQPQSEDVVRMTIYVDGKKLVAFGDSWRGEGSFDGRRGFYNFRDTDGQTGRTDFFIDENGALHGKVRGSGMGWNFIAMRK